MNTRFSKNVTVRELCEGFEYNELEGKGLYGLNGKLTIQPAYQRNYIYADGKRDVAVIESMMRGCLIGLLYLSKVGDEKYEVLDGQQRITSIGRFITGKFSIKDETGASKYFEGLSETKKLKFLNTELLICICEGTEDELMEWFKTINVAGIPLNDQELLNAIYSGTFTTLAREEFSNSKNPNLKKWSVYIKGSPLRQDYLKTAIHWVSNGDINGYMSKHRLDSSIYELKTVFDNVINWVSKIFTKTYEEMTGVDWGSLYRQYGEYIYDIDELNLTVQSLMSDPYIKNPKGIFEYALGGCNDSKLLDVRIFDEATKRKVYNIQTKKAREESTSNCRICKEGGDKVRHQKMYELKDMEADHITAWSKGGLSNIENCELLCKLHNRMKGNK